MIDVILILVVLLLMWHSRNRSREEVDILGYKTKYFHLSQGKSKEIYEQMQKHGLSGESLKLFVMLEDRLLKLEKESVCSGISRDYEALVISNQIKDSFLGYDFSHHTIHLKQNAEPHKLINRSIIC